MAVILYRPSKRYREPTMLLPTAFYPHAECIAKHLPHLRPSQVKGLALWTGATILARSGCQNAVLGVLQTLGFGWHATRQYLREWLYDGADRAAPCGVQLDVQACFAPLLRWVLAWWQGSELTLAVDPTAKGGELVALVVSVVYRGLAIPVAWRIRTGGRPGPWMPDLCALLDRLGPAVPEGMTVRVLCDRGLQSPDLWAAIRRRGWHPYMRYDRNMTFPGDHGTALAGLALRGRGRAVHGDGREGLPRPQAVLHPDCAVGARPGGPLDRAHGRAPRRRGPRRLRPAGLDRAGLPHPRRMGWQWHRSRRLDPDRVDRHWLVLAVATLRVPAAARAWRRPCCAAGRPVGYDDRPRSRRPPSGSGP